MCTYHVNIYLSKYQYHVNTCMMYLYDVCDCRKSWPKQWKSFSWILEIRSPFAPIEIPQAARQPAARNGLPFGIRRVWLAIGCRIMLPCKSTTTRRRRRASSSGLVLTHTHTRTCASCASGRLSGLTESLERNPFARIHCFPTAIPFSILFLFVNSRDKIYINRKDAWDSENIPIYTHLILYYERGC